MCLWLTTEITESVVEINGKDKYNKEENGMETLTLKNNGFSAYYFQGKISPEKAIIVVGGASCNEKVTLAMSQVYVKTGYNVLVLGYYMWKGLPQSLAGIPVDYCEKAVKWLKNEKHIAKIAMTGASTGAAYTMLCASYISDITCVIPVVPFDYVLEGTTSTNKRMHCSIYTYHGKDVPYSPMEQLDNGMLWWLREAKKAEGYGLSRFMRWGYDVSAPCLTEESRIKTENMNADVLLLAVKNDDCWPSDIALPRIVDNLKSAGYQHKVEYHIYEKGSHALTDGLDKSGLFLKFLIKTMVPAEKKYPKECEEARQDSFRRILKFLKEW